jgi:RNA polymerase-binding transcription factor DksA
MSTRAADILGLNRAGRIPPKWARLYERLCAERNRLMARDHSAYEPPSSVKMDDLTEAATEESARSIFLVTASATQATIVEVVEAIQRIEHGTYGVCEITGKPIERERLLAIPWARCSFQGQSEVEKSGLRRRIALPSLESLSDPNLVPEEPAEAEETA